MLEFYLPMTVKIKICCISSLEEAALAIQCGANALGLVSAMPSGPGVISESLIEEIAESVPPSVDTFLLTALQEANAIIAQHARCRTSTIQLVDAMTPQALKELRHALPHVQLVQVIHVFGTQSIDDACAVAPLVDAILLDSGNQTLPVKELGGTGRTHDWSISQHIRERCAKPVFLAGGLTPANVANAIHAVKPAAVDICSGVRSDGKLDVQKLTAFIAAARAANSRMAHSVQQQ